jgi:hypothetical protein
VGLSGWTQRDPTKQCFFIPFLSWRAAVVIRCTIRNGGQSQITPQEQPHPDERISSEVSGSAVFRNRRPDLCSVGPKQGVPKVGRADETVLQRRGLPRWWLAVASSNPCGKPCLGTDPPVSLQGTTLRRASQVCEGLLASCLVQLCSSPLALLDSRSSQPPFLSLPLTFNCPSLFSAHPTLPISSLPFTPGPKLAVRPRPSPAEDPSDSPCCHLS